VRKRGDIYSELLKAVNPSVTANATTYWRAQDILAKWRV
jgi:hypothetical protein